MGPASDQTPFLQWGTISFQTPHHKGKRYFFAQTLAQIMLTRSSQQMLITQASHHRVLTEAKPRELLTSWRREHSPVSSVSSVRLSILPPLKPAEAQRHLIS